jgi:hypothetical protein
MNSNRQANQNSQHGGYVSSSGNRFDSEDDLLLYKAKKYHYKCQAKLKEMMAQGKSCPVGYEKYLEPFRP